jgi:nucleotide-binding universal stress UspA family protein
VSRAAARSWVEKKERPEAAGVFARVLVGVDRTPASLAAVRQAGRLTEPDGTLTFLAAWTFPRRTLEPDATTTMLAATTGPPVTYGIAAPRRGDKVAEVGRKAAEHAVATARAGVPPSATRIVEGVAWEELLAEIGRERSTLVAVGSHGHGRLEGIVKRSTMTEVLHKSSCSVLVARPTREEFPRRIVLGVDRSPASRFAQEVARHLAERFGSELRPFATVDALLAASADADLLVVGSRGLHGVPALGSVSERVAHAAHCSTLVVRALHGTESSRKG